METNYTLKKLIRGGTLLVFLFAFMLAGPLASNAQDKAVATIDLEIVGEGSVYVSWLGGGGTLVGTNIVGPVSSSTISGIPANAEVTFVVTAAPCWEFDLWGVTSGYPVPGGQNGTYTLVANPSLHGGGNIQVVAMFEKVKTDYEFSVAAIPTPVCTGVAVDVDVTFSNNPCAEGLTGQRFKFKAEGPGNITLSANDSNGAPYSVTINGVTQTPNGYWGPSSGFPIPAVYSATTTWNAEFSVAGTYTITFMLIDATTEVVTEGIMEEVVITVSPTPSVIVDTGEPITFCYDTTPVDLTEYFELVESISGTWSFEGTGVSGSNWDKQLNTTTTLTTITATFTTDAGCVDSESIEFTVYPIPDFAFSFTDGIDTFCFDETISIDITNNGDANVEPITITWAILNNNGTVYSGTDVVVSGTMTFDILDYSGLGFGVYTATVSNLVDNNGCSPTSYDNFVLSFTINPEPEFDFDTDKYEYCYNDDIVLFVENDGDGPNTAVVDWNLYRDGSLVFSETDIAIGIGSQTFSITDHVVLSAGTYSATITKLVDDNGCSPSDYSSYVLEFIILEEPMFTIGGILEICATETTTLTAAGADFASAVWFVDGAEIAGQVLDSFTFDPADFGHVVTTTSTYVVGVIVTDEGGCVAQLVTETITVNAVPYITKNEVLPPLYNGEVKTVFCTEVPAGLVIRGEDDVEWAPTPQYDEICDPTYRWLKSTNNGDTWVSTGFGADNQRHYTMPRLTVTTWYKRQVTLDCECALEEWHDSNIIKMIVVPADYFVADAGADQEICFDADITLGAVAAPEFSTGVWSGPANISFSDINDETATITSTIPGSFELTWTIVQDDIVAACAASSDKVTVVFEQLTVENLVLPTEVANVCVDAGAIDLVGYLPTVGTIPTSTYTYAFSGNGVVSNVFTPATAGVGVHTITLIVNTDNCEITKEATIEVYALPANPTVQNEDVCFDDSPHGFLVNMGSGNGSGNGPIIDYSTGDYDLYFREGVLVEGSFTFTGDFTKVTTANPLPVKTAVGRYAIQVKHVRSTAPFCESELRVAELTIRALPVISSVAVTSDNTCYGEVIEVTVTHTSGAVLNTPDYLADGWDDVVAIAPGTTTTVLTFAGESLDIGIHTWVFTVDYTHSSQVTCTSNPVTAVFEVTPPVYAMFSPFYRKDANGKIIDIPEGSSIDNPTGQSVNGTPLVTYVPIQQANDNGIFVEFSAPVTSQGPAWLPLPEVNQGEFILLHKNTGTVESPTWVKVDVVVTEVGDNKFAVRPYDFSANENKDLEWATMYRLSHQNVYKTSCGEEQPVVYRLSKIAQGLDNSVSDFGVKSNGSVYAYDEDNTNAYSKNPAVYFQTMPESFVNLPKVYPTDDDARCKEIYVDFANPVSYLSNQEITAGGEPKFKFDLQKYVDGEWVSQVIIDKVIPSMFADAEPVPSSGPVRGPKRMTITLTRELDYGAEYRIAMTEATNPVETVGGYGFRDLNLGNIVLGAEFAFDTQNTGLGGGWSWSTASDYPVVFDIEPWPTDWFGTKSAPVPTTMNNITFDNAFDNVVSSVENPVGVFSLVKEDEAYDVDFFGGNFTVTADPGEGYHFVRWKRSTDGGANFVNLATTGSGWQTPGYHYFPASFTFHPDTFAVRTSAATPAVYEDVWIHAECDDELVYKAEFAKNTYTVRSYPAKEDAPTTVDNVVGIANTLGGDLNKVHGTTVTIEATPKAGYYFIGWNTDLLPDGVVATEVYTPPSYEDIINPLDHTAKLELELLGAHAHGTTMTVYALFDVFEPKIYAAAQGINKDGSIAPNITNIEFKTLFVANIQQTGVEAAFDFSGDVFNFYEWATFKYGNPSYPPNVAFSAVEVRPLDVPCEYVFDTWERWDPTIGPDGAFRPVIASDGQIVDESFTFIPTENYRLRATFLWKNDLTVSVAIDDTYVTDPNATGTYTVKNLRTNVSYQSSAASYSYEPWDIIEITIYPPSGYMTYGWVDGNGNVIPTYEDMDEFLAQGDTKVGGIIKEDGFPKRLSDNQFQTIWRYIVGCEGNVDLKAVMAKKRFHVEAYVNPENLGSVTAWAAQFPVNPHPIVIGGTPVIFGYWDEDMARLGFVASPTTGAKKSVEGYFEKGVDITVTVNETAATATVIPEFDRWMLKDNGNWVDLGAPEAVGKTVTKAVLGDMVLQAAFINTYEPNRWRVVLAENPDGASYSLTQNAGPMYNAGQSITVTAVPKVGYDFSHWTSSVVIGLTPLQMQNASITFNAPANPPALVSEILLTANYVKTDYDVIAKTRTYMKTDGVLVWPWTDGAPYLIGEEQETPVAGGTVTATAAASPTTFGTEVTVKAKPFAGFRLINFMVGNVLDDGAVEGIQINPSTDDFVYWAAGADYEEFTFTIPEGDDLGIWFTNVDELQIFAIFGETGNEEFPGHKLVTRSQPAGFAVVKSDPNFLTNEKADGLFVYGSIVPVSQHYTQLAIDNGYAFSEWVVNVRDENGVLLESQEYTSLDEVEMVFDDEGDYLEVVAVYEALTYNLVVNNFTPAYGTVTGSAPYTMSSDPLPVSAVVAEPTCEEEFMFLGWYRDAAFTVPFLDEGGIHITDLNFDFVPEVVIPWPNTELHIYAKFESAIREYTVDLFVNLPYGTDYPAAGTTLIDGVATANATFTCGEQVEITAVPNPNGAYIFERWVDEDGVQISTNRTFLHTIGDDVQFTAIYRYTLYDLTLIVNPYAAAGTLTAVPAKPKYNIGDEVSVTATAAAGYAFVEFETLPAGAVVNGNVVEFVWGADDVTVEAVFELITYDVTFVVTDAEGVAVTDAVVTLNGVTNPAGNYLFADIAPGTYNYTVTKAGFLPRTGTVVVTNQDVTVNVSFADCPAVTGLDAEVTSKTAFVSWNADANTSWRVRVNGGAWTTVSTTSRSYSNLTPGTTYEYEVQAICGEGVYSAIAELEFTTLEKGDVNADRNLNSSDLDLIVAYINGTLAASVDVIFHANEITGEEDALFIFDAADLAAAFGTINVLDIVAWINNFFYGDAKSGASLNSKDADIYLAPGMIRLESDGTLTALQFQLHGFNLNDISLTAVKAGYLIEYWIDGNVLNGIIYSPENRAIEAGLVDLISITGDGLSWGNVFAGNLNADEVYVNTHDVSTDVVDPSAFELSLNVYPNPSRGQFTSSIDVPVSSRVVLSLIDMVGREVSRKQVQANGTELVSWNETLESGYYILRMVATPDNAVDQSFIREVRILINK